MYIWQIPDDYPEKMVGEYDRASSGNRFLLKKGEPIPADFKTPRVRFSARSDRLRMFDDLANSALVPLVSPKVASVLLNLAHNDVQLVNSIVQAADAEILDYSIVVAISIVKAVDMEKSEYSLVPSTSKIMSFRKLSLLPNPLGGRHLARAEEYHSFLLVSKELRDALLQGRPSGLGLYVPEEMSL